MVGMNLDSSHLFWTGGALLKLPAFWERPKSFIISTAKISAPSAVPAALTECRTPAIDAFRERIWNYVSVGARHGVQWRQEIFSEIRMSGCEEIISLEMEDLTLPMKEEHIVSLRTLKEVLVLLILWLQE